MDTDLERLERLMEEANVNYRQRDEFRADPPRAIALLDHALRRRAVTSPAAYALSRFRRGDWPGRTNGRDRSRPASAAELVSRRIHGFGWDESYGAREMLEEIEELYAKRGERLLPNERERLLSLWQAEAIRRYAPEPVDAVAIAAELRALPSSEQLPLLDG